MVFDHVSFTCFLNEPTIASTLHAVLARCVHIHAKFRAVYDCRDDVTTVMLDRSWLSHIGTRRGRGLVFPTGTKPSSQNRQMCSHVCVRAIV